MLFWIIQVSIMSIIIVFLVDNIMTFFKSTLTVTKTKNIVYDNNDKSTNEKNTILMTNNSNNANNNSYTEIDLLPSYPNIMDAEGNAQGTDDVFGDEEGIEEEEEESMKDELKNFLKNQLNPTN